MKKLITIAVLLAATTLASAENVREAIARRHGANKNGAPAAATQSAAPASKADAVWRELAAGNRRFTTHHVNERKELANGQHPRAIVLTCSDSRVSPELIFEQSLGELFVIRVAGNTADRLALGSIEYALEHLHSPLLVVLGHDKCGAVNAALAGGKLPTANLEAVVARIRPAIDTTSKDDAALARAVAANVQRSANDLTANSEVIRAHVERGNLRIVKAVYHLASGAVETLN
jgi:carbonic anhydrase